MCGILAIARSFPTRADTPFVDAPSLERAMSRLRRRGPDGEGQYLSTDRRVLFAHTRLAIQDLSDAGRQPMTDGTADPRVVVTFNGEIYNAPTLRDELERAGFHFRSRTDTEVLIHGYLHWGFDGLLARLCGMFAFVLLDHGQAHGSPTIHAAVDPAGMKPLIYTHFIGHEGGTLALASDCDTLLAALAGEPGFTKRLDSTALCHVLSVGYCPAPVTMWRNVYKLRPGEKLSWSTGDSVAPRVDRYWQPPEELRALQPADEREHFESLFRTVVDDHLLSDVPVGLFLSAGLDSSSIALALAQAQRSDDVTAFTLASPGIDPAFDEGPVAASLARAMMMRHRTIDFASTDLHATLLDAAAAFDEPQGFTALLTATRIARRSRDARLSVVLAGDGGDEAFAGYSWHTSAPHTLSLDPACIRPHSSGPVSARLDQPNCEPEARAAAFVQLAHRSYTHRALCRAFPGFHPVESRSLLAALEPEYDESTFANWLAPEDRPALPHPRRSQRLDIMGFCACSILPKIDRAAMHVALELRAPFLDRRVLDWALARPVDPTETDPSRTKPMLRSFLQRGLDAGLVPAPILNRPKQGFSLRLGADRPFESLATSMLPGSRLIRDGIVRRDHAAYLPADRDTRQVRLFTLCMLAAWYEQR